MTHDADPARNPSSADAVRAAIDGRRLLDHPFYRRWEAGELSGAELAEYAVHYRAFEEALPGILADVVEQLTADDELEVADMVARNLADELGRPEPHLALFDSFAAALPTPRHATGPGPTATALVDAYRFLTERSPSAAIAGLAAYEVQAAEIAATKGDGLRRWYGMDDTGTRFWDVHATMDADHGRWAVEALDALGADAGEVTDAARRAADAWWALLDERQTEAGLAA